MSPRSSAALLAVLTACASEPSRSGGDSVRSDPAGRAITSSLELAPAMIFVEGGRFTMGDVFGEGREEAIPHEVRLGDYYLSRDEVTVAQFRRFVEATGFVTRAEREGTALVYRFVSEEERGWEETSGIAWRDPGYEQGDDHPVVAVTWDDAMAYAEWLAEETGRPYRLPTEAEWEYAARAGGQRIPWPWGEAPPSGDRLNFADASTSYPWSVDSIDDGHSRTAPVGTYGPDGFGFHDLAGNVWEWCLDRYAPYQEGSADDPTGPTAGENRVMRSGSWINAADFARTTRRNWDDPANRYVNLGFRVALPAP